MSFLNNSVSVLFSLLFILSLIIMLSRFATGFKPAYLGLKISRLGGAKHLASSRYTRKASRVYNTPGTATRPNEDLDPLSHLQIEGTQITPYWLSQLKNIDKPVAKTLIAQLSPANPAGYVPVTGPARDGTLVHFYIQEKKKHANKVVLMRCGDFYETYGMDAIMCVAYCGLNPMGNKCKAGCPIGNVQATLDGLTSAGLTVAVYEEVTELDSGRGPKAKTEKAKLKTRLLTQIVSPASSTYAHDLTLRSDEIDFPENRPAIGILQTNAGYTVCEIYMDERYMAVSERLTEEAVRALVSTVGAIDPIFIQAKESAPSSFFLAKHTGTTVEHISGYEQSSFPSQVLKRVCNMFEVDSADFRVFPKSTVARPRPIYTSTALQVGLLPNENVPNLIPHLLTRGHGQSSAFSTRFLRKWLLNPPPYNVADRMRNLVRELSNSMQPLPSFYPVSVGKVVSLLTAKQCNVALFQDIRHNVEGVWAMLEQSNSSKSNAIIVESMLALTSFESGMPASADTLKNSCQRVLAAIDAVVASGDELVNAQRQSSSPSSSSASSSMHSTTSDSQFRRVPAEYFRRNEEGFIGKITEQNPEAVEIFAAVKTASDNLCEVVNREFPLSSDVQLDLLCNSLFIKKGQTVSSGGGSSSSSSSSSGSLEEELDSADHIITNSDNIALFSPSSSSSSSPAQEKPKYISFIDRKGKVKSGRATTNNVMDAERAYIDACEDAPRRIAKLLMSLSEELQQELLSIVQVSHWAVILQTAMSHSIATVRQKRWSIPVMTDTGAAGAAGDATHGCDEKGIGNRMRLKSLIPYWISSNSAVTNDVDLQGIFLLTAPNMSGKSTLMRSALVAALLANCGLAVPCISSSSSSSTSSSSSSSSGSSAEDDQKRQLAEVQVPRYDNFFLRTASFDIPSEAKSAFAHEAEDIRVILRDSTNNSLVMVDELGKGTSARDGSALSGALLEQLCKIGVSGVFATHLHEIFQLPLQIESVQEKKMGFKYSIPSFSVGAPSIEAVEWTYKLEDGRCEDSMALATARSYGVEEIVIRRAQQLAIEFDSRCRHSSTTLASNDTQHQTAVEGKIVVVTAEQGNMNIEGCENRIQSGHCSDAFSLQNAAEVLKEEALFAAAAAATTGGAVAASVAPVDIDAVLIADRFEAPAALEGSSVVYVLQISRRRSSLSPPTRPSLSSGVPSSTISSVRGASSTWYVGETESITQRLRQHRRRYNSYDIAESSSSSSNDSTSSSRSGSTGGAFAVSAIALKVPNKSIARRVESSVISRLKAKGMIIEHDSDEAHSLFGA